MKFTANQIATVLKGEIVGDPNVEVHTFSKIEEGFEGAISFLANPKYEPYLHTTNSSIIIVNNSFVLDRIINKTLIKVDDAYLSFTILLEFYDQATRGTKNGIEQPSFLHEKAKYGLNLYLGAFAYVSENVILGDNVKIYPSSFIDVNVKIGNNVIIFAGAKIHSDTIIGNNCVIYSGAVIGADGFGFAPNEHGTYVKIPQIGNVIIEDNVDIGANTTIDKATMGSTIIRKGVKLDNQIQIGHNVEIGENSVIAAQTGIAGSTKVGANAKIGGQVGIVGHITIGDNVRIQAQSGVTRNVKDAEVIQGTPAFSYNDFSKSYIHFKNLPKNILELEKIKKEIANHKNENNG